MVLEHIVNDENLLMETLHENPHILSLILHSIQGGIIISDSSNKFSYINQRFAELFQIPKDIIQTHNRMALRNVIKRRVKNPDQLFSKVDGLYDSFENFQEIIELVDGKFYEYYSTPLLKEDELLGRVWLVKDITEQKKAKDKQAQLENQLIQSQKMESIGTLAGGIAHDFNNILMVVMGYSQMALKKIAPTDSLYKEIEQIYEASKRGASLIQKLLAFSRKQIVNPCPINLNDRINELFDMLKRILGEDIEIKTFLDSNLGLISIDPGQIDQLILNLSANARDAMPHGGKVFIRTKTLHLDDDSSQSFFNFPNNSYVLLSYNDTGLGIPKEIQPKIFDPYFTTKDNGTGLGLSTVYGIIKQNKGYISVYSEREKGTTFNIYFPQIKNPSHKTREKQTPPLNLDGTETILIVEDDETVRLFFKKSFEEKGYTVLDAAGFNEAIDLFNNTGKKIDLLVADIILPNCTGKDIAKTLITFQPTLKVLYVSGYPDDLVDLQAIQEERAHFMQKPFTATELVTNARKILDTQ